MNGIGLGRKSDFFRMQLLVMLIPVTGNHCCCISNFPRNKHNTSAHVRIVRYANDSVLSVAA